MKKIIVVTSSYPLKEGDFNGVFVHELCKALKKDVEVLVVAPWVNGVEKEEVINGIKIFRHSQFFWNINFAYGTDISRKLEKNPFLYFVSPFFLIYQILLIKKLVSKYKVEIIHAQWLFPAGLAAVLYKLIFNTKIKIVVTLLGSDIWHFNKGWRAKLARFVMNNSNFVGSQSSALFQEAKRLGLKNAGGVIPLGIDTDKFNPAKFSLELKQTYSPNGPLILFVGTLVPNKGIFPLIIAAKELKKHHPEFKLLVIGEGDLMADIKSFINENNLSNNITLLGVISNDKLPTYFATSDIFILPSFSEGFPLVVMEALSSGANVVVSNISAYSLLKKEGNLIKMIQPGNSESIFSILNEMLNNPKALTKNKILSRNYAVNEFDVKTSAMRYNEVYSLI
jgi:glycosyltransferase involved in cell wall biosynthesis